jgi:hypothetical protein
MIKKYTKCIYGFTSNMCGRGKGCKGCKSNVEERKYFIKRPEEIK